MTSVDINQFIFKNKDWDVMTSESSIKIDNEESS